MAQMNGKNKFPRHCIKLGKETISNMLVTKLYASFSKVLPPSGPNEAKKWHK